MQDLCMRAPQPGGGQLISGSSGLRWRMQGGGQGACSGLLGASVFFFFKREIEGEREREV